MEVKIGVLVKAEPLRHPLLVAPILHRLHGYRRMPKPGRTLIR